MPSPDPPAGPARPPPPGPVAARPAPGGVPEVPGILTAEEILATGRSIARVQQADGAIGWPDGHVDSWNHTECAMALSACGLREPARRAYRWLRITQRGDGSWPRRAAGGAVADPAAESNHAAYPAVGVWHELLVTGDLKFARLMWPTVRAGIEYALSLQVPRGEIIWRPAGRAVGADQAAFALLAGCASMHQSLRCAAALADRLGAPRPGWELAAGQLGHVVARHRDAFADKSRFSMDWYYPVLGGAVRGPAAATALAADWQTFVVPGLGVRCVSDEPWVTAAETCELVLALEAIGDFGRALELFAQIQQLRDPGGGYWTGWQYANQAHFPAEQSSWTAAAVILAADALSAATGGSGIFRDAAPAPEVLAAGTGVPCGCGGAAPSAGAAWSAGPVRSASTARPASRPAQPIPSAIRSSTRSEPVTRTSAKAPDASAR